jgi:hypothetical protein
MLPPRQSFAQRYNQINSGFVQDPSQQDPNFETPIGDPIDQIAQMLGLDLSNTSSPDQQGAKVVQAVEALVSKLHELSGESECDPEMDSEEDDPNEDPSEEYEDPNEGDPNEEATDDPESDPENDIPPARNKFKGGGLSLALSHGALRLAISGREAKITHLMGEGFISPAMGKQLKADYCSKQAISLALSLDEDASDEFDKVCALFKKNGRILKLSEESGPQTGLSRLDPEDGSLENILDTSKNPLLANAISRGKK